MVVVVVLVVGAGVVVVVVVVVVDCFLVFFSMGLEFLSTLETGVLVEVVRETVWGAGVVVVVVVVVLVVEWEGRGCLQATFSG